MGSSSEGHQNFDNLFTVEATAGEHWRTVARGKNVPDYAKIMGLLIGVVAAGIVSLA